MRTALLWTYIALSLSLLGCAGGPSRGADSTMGGASTGGSRHLALLVGIGKYYQLQPRSGYRPWPELHTEAELEHYRQVLIRYYGFAEQDMKVLREQEATTSNIREAFRKHLIEQARPGDVVVFHFSGHGQQIPDDAGRPDEADGLDESLVTYDSLDQSWQEGSQKNIRDDELGDWLDELAARMHPSPGAPMVGNITVTLDACFSGSATRGTLLARGRSWDESLDGPPPPLHPSLPAKGGAGFLTHRASLHQDVTVVAAARADQSAWERSGQGVFTRQWVGLLARADRSTPLTYQSAVDRLAIDLAAEGLEQTPQVDGDPNKLIFSGLAVTLHNTNRAWRALWRKGSLWLQGGEVHGVTKGSRYALYEAGAAIAPETASLGEALIEEVSPFLARLGPLPGARLAQQRGVLAVETQHSYALAPLRVVLIGFSDGRQLRERISKLEIVTVVHEQKVPGPLQIDHDLLLRFDSEQQHIHLLRPDGTALSSIEDKDLIGALEKQLVSEWRRHHFASLRNESSDVRIDLTLIPMAANYNPQKELIGTPLRLASPLPSAHLVLPTDKAFGMRLGNRSDRTLCVSVIAISPDGDIDVLFGKNEKGKNCIPKGRVDLEPPDVVFALQGKPGEQMVIKAIATEQYVDFSGIESSLKERSRGTGVVAPAAPVYAPLQQLLHSIGSGARSGGIT